jgi:hypothetical protein
MRLYAIRREGPVLLLSMLLMFGATPAVMAPTPTGPARLVKDINTTPTRDAGSFPSGFVRLGDTLLFTASRPDLGE